MKTRLNNENIHTTSGASFFILSEIAASPASVHLAAVESFGLMDDISGTIMSFLGSNNLSPGEIDLVLYSNSGHDNSNGLIKIFGEDRLMDYQKLSGTYYTNSSFALHYGADLLLHRSHPISGGRINQVLVCNNLILENLGLILLNNKNQTG